MVDVNWSYNLQADSIHVFLIARSHPLRLINLYLHRSERHYRRNLMGLILYITHCQSHTYIIVVYGRDRMKYKYNIQELGHCPYISLTNLGEIILCVFI